MRTVRIHFAALAAVFGVLVTAPGALGQDVEGVLDAGVGDVGDTDGGAADAAAPEETSSIAATQVIQQAHDQDTLLDERRAELEGQPEIDAVRSRLTSAIAEFENLGQGLESEALKRANRSELNDRLRALGTVADALDSDAEVLVERLTRLEEIALELETAESQWATTVQELTTTPDTPPAAVARSLETSHRIEELGAMANERISAVVALQARLVEQSEHVEQAQALVTEARSQMRAQLLRPVMPPLWEGLSAESHGPPTLVTMDGTWESFLSQYGHKLPLHAGFVLALFIFVLGLSRWTTANATGEAKASVAILERPAAAAAMVALVSVRFVYTQAPVAIFHVAGVLALLPLFRLLPLLVRNQGLHRPLWGLMVLLSLQELAIFAPLSGASGRLLSLGISLGLLALLLWVFHRKLAIPDEESGRIERAVPHVLKGVAALLVVSALAEVFGYTNLAGLLTPGLLIDIYVVLLLVAAVRVLNALITATLMSHWAQVSRAVRSDGPLIGARLRSALRVAAIAAWLYGTLRIFDLDEAVFAGLSAMVGASVTAGSWTISLGDVLRFVFVVWVTVVIARLVVFLLREEIFPHFELPRGMPSTISRLVRYIVWALGFIFAVGAAGVDLSSLALLVSALSVGIGFGLQNIVNNFVSGLILIFERPIRAGDTVELSGMLGQVKAIGLRASTVRTPQGSEVIVPNADLVSSQVINWTLSDQERRVEVPVGVAYGTDPEIILAMLSEVAASIEEVQSTPAALPLFKGFGDSSLDFELRFWVNLRYDWPTVASKVAVEINRRLTEMNIEIPFPQRDLHVRSIEPELTKLLEPK